MNSENTENSAQANPFVSVVRGEPTDDELIALVTGILTMRNHTDDATPDATAAPEEWANRARLLHTTAYGQGKSPWKHSLQP